MAFTLTNCRITADHMPITVFSSSSILCGLLLKIFHASHNIYAAPIIVIYGLIEGIRLYNVMLKKLHTSIIKKNHIKTPKLKGRLFLNPYFVALVIDIILLGPGVKLVIKAYDIKADKLGIINLRISTHS